MVPLRILVLLAAGCAVTAPCPGGTTAVPEGCVPSDGGASADGDPVEDAHGAADGCASVFYADRDGDGHGDPSRPTAACVAPLDHVSDGDDCDDGDRRRHPGASEACDGGDEDCDERIDEGALTTWYADLDMDGHGDPAAAMPACAMPAGFVALSDDCDDTSDQRFSGNAERCDDLDNDCDAPEVDEDFPCRRGAAIVCTTACGSAGTGRCTDTCGVPAAADCTPPVETCEGTDEDCDGLVDEGLGAVGPRRELGATSGRTVVVRASRSFVAVTHRAGTGLVGQRFDLGGAPAGGEVVLTATATDDFDAWAVGDRLALAWHDRTSFFVASVPETLAAASGVNVGASDAFFGRVQVVAAGASVLVVYFDGNASRLMAIQRTFPAIGGAAAPFLVANAVRGTFDLTLDGAGERAYAAYVTSTDDVTVATLRMTGSTEAGAAISFGTANPQRAPALAFGVAPGGALRLGVAYHENPASGDAVVLRSVNVSGGTLTLQDTVTALAASPPDTLADPLGVTHAGGRWFVSALVAATASTSSWRLAQVLERPGMVPTTGGVTLEATAAGNRGVSLAPGDGGTVFTAGGRSDGVGRGYLWGCP